MSLLVPVLSSVVLIFPLLVLVLCSYMKWKHQYWSKTNIPYKTPSIPFGNLQSPSKKTCSIGFQIKNLYDEAKKKGLKHYGVYFFASPVYLVVDLEYLKNVTTKYFEHFTDRGMYYNEKSDPISAHLFAIGGSKWTYFRTKISPTFTASKMKTMFPSIVECVSLLMEQIGNEFTEIDVKELLGRFTTDVIGSCAFGLDCNTIKEENSPFRIYGKKIFTSSKLRSLKMTFVSNFPALGRLLGVKQVPSDVSEFFSTIVKETIRYRHEKNFTRPDFMQMLIDLEKEGNALTLDEIAAQCFSFFAAGFETSSTTMTFALYELAKNQEVQDKLRSEILTVLQRHNGAITYEAISEMEYLNRVIDESLRKYPPVPFVTRKCVKDFKIPDVDATIKKDLKVIVPILAIHYDPEYYPEPYRFDPERFSDSNKHTRHSHAYIPFGEGPRICIGMRFGLMQTKVGLVALVRKYKFSVNPRTSEPLRMAVNSFTLVAEGGIWLDSQNI